MRSIARNLRIRLLEFAVIVLGLFSLPVSGAAAEISPSGGPDQKSQTAHGFQIKFIHPHAKQLCVGQKTILEAEFGPENFLTPLIDISSINFWSTNGNTLSQEALFPFVKAGVVSTVFTAKKPGTDTINADVAVYQYEKGTPIGELISDYDETTIEVLETCQYHYTLHGELIVELVEGEISETLHYTLDAEGDLLADDPDQPNLLTGEGGTISMEAMITELTMPDCTLISQDPGLGYGSIDATAEMDPDAQTIKVTLGPPQNFVWTKTAVGQCGDETIPVTMSTVIQTEGNFVDGEVFSIDGGVHLIPLEFFELGLERLQSVASGSYTTVLSLEALDSHE
jgi:hypothetical protein